MYIRVYIHIIYTPYIYIYIYIRVYTSIQRKTVEKDSIDFFVTYIVYISTIDIDFIPDYKEYKLIKNIILNNKFKILNTRKYTI